MIGTESSLTQIWNEFIDRTASIVGDILNQFSSTNLVTLEEKQDIGTFLVRIHTSDGKDRTEIISFLPQDPSKQMGIGRIANDVFGNKIHISLNASRFLIREIPLPPQAETFVHNIIDTQIDQLTPWSKDKALFGHKILRKTNENIFVALAATDKQILEPLLKQLETLKPSALSLSVSPSTTDRTPEIPLLTKDLGRLPFNQLRKILSYFLIIALGVSALVNIYSTWRISALNEEYETVQNQISAGRTISKEPSTLNEVELQMFSHKLYSLPLTLVLEEVAKVLPDNSSLTELEYVGNTIRIVGVSEDPSSLINSIEQSKILADAKFFSATTKGPEDKGGQFHIEAQIKPEEIIVP